MREFLPILDLFEQGGSDAVLAALLLLLPILPNLWCIWHAYKHEFDTPHERLAWMGAGVFLPVAGGLLYLLLGLRRTRGKAVW